MDNMKYFLDYSFHVFMIVSEISEVFIAVKDI